MAPSNDPVEFVEKGVSKLHARVIFYLKKVWKRVRSLLMPLRKFMKKMLSAAKSIAKTAGKKAVSQVTSAGQTVLNLLDRVEQMLKSMIKLGQRILDTIRKNTDRSRLVRVLKTVVRKYVEMFRQVWGWVQEIWEQIGVLDTALSILNRFASVLQIVFGWIKELTTILGGVKKVKGMLKKVVKTLRLEIKEAIRLLKDVAKLPVPKEA
ncbi:hypothetical protein RA19_02570 [Leisingera sp. ANG-M1]|uniref:hypothetical protein n=1 Tax=Leisingera sp. ANG-M1 TaxID=1577895 RepID=UPI00057CB150|nr:hypothetical protein [Leisingera sp. ANG-M1]KIC12151.1 hypothetical protein RA19_02570 [Leisingera sp. ANG-M1]